MASPRIIIPHGLAADVLRELLAPRTRKELRKARARAEKRIRRALRKTVRRG